MSFDLYASTIRKTAKADNITVTTTTTDRNITFFESPANVAWFAALMMLLAALAVFLMVEAYRSKLIFKIKNI
jgi:hypothetical protein